MTKKTRLTVLSLAALLALAIVSAAVAHRVVVIKGTNNGETLTGTIINFHREKGYGFIQCAIRPNNVFFHIRNDVDENVVAMIEAIAEATTGWRQLDIPVTFREKWIGKARGHKPAAFDIKPYAPAETMPAFSQ